MVLERWRRDRGDAANLPYYLVVGDRSLEELARVRPMSIGDLRRIYGLGSERIDRYGGELVQVIREFVREL